MSSQTKLFAIIGGILIIAAGAFYFIESKPPAAPAAERGVHPQ